MTKDDERNAGPRVFGSRRRPGGGTWGSIGAWVSNIVVGRDLFVLIAREALWRKPTMVEGCDNFELLCSVRLKVKFYLESTDTDVDDFNHAWTVVWFVWSNKSWKMLKDLARRGRRRRRSSSKTRIVKSFKGKEGRVSEWVRAEWRWKKEKNDGLCIPNSTKRDPLLRNQ